MNDRRYQFLLILFIALILRLAWLGSKSLWLDEAFTVWHSGRPVIEIWNESHDNHPPLYYLMMHAWLTLGRSEAWVRLPSVAASLAGLGMMFFVGRRLLPARAALLAVGLLAVAPLDLWYAQEAWMVSFVIAPALIAAFGLVTIDRGGGWLFFLGFALGLYIDYTTIPLWAIMSAVWLAWWWQSGRPRRSLTIWIVASLAGWLVFLPRWWHLALVLDRMSNIFFFANFRRVLNLPAIPAASLLLLLTALMAIVFAVVVLGNRAMTRPNLRTPLALLVVVTFVIMTALSPLPRLYSLKRILVTGWPLFIILVTWLVGRLKVPKGLALGLLFVSGLASLATLAVPKDDWRAAVGYLNQQAETGDLVWLDPFSGQLPYSYYRPRFSPLFSPDMLPRPPLTGIWHIAERQPGKAVPSSQAEQWLDANRRLVEVVPFYRLELRYYRPEQ